MNHFFEWIKNTSTSTKGGEGSGNFGHSGRPGKVGGSSSGNEVSRGVFNEKEEEDKLFEPWQGQHRNLKPGVTREQAASFYKKRGIVRGAQGIVYRSGEFSNRSAKDVIDELVGKGYKKRKSRQVGRLELFKPHERGEDAFSFVSKAEHDYINMLLEGEK